MKNQIISQPSIKQFERSIFFPFLDFLPKVWFQDFHTIFLSFNDSQKILTVYAQKSPHGQVLYINIDLNRAYGQTSIRKEFGKTLFNFYGTLCMLITTAVHKYNYDKHPELVTDKNIKTIVLEFMKKVMKHIRKRPYNPAIHKYIA